MAGKKGRSGGHNKLSVAEHIRRGTFRASRHGAHLKARTSPTRRVKVKLAVPKELSPEARAEWNRVVARLEMAGLLAKTDDLLIESYCRLSAVTARLQREVDQLPATFTTAPSGRVVPHPTIAQLRQFRLAEMRYLAEMKLTPGSRSKEPSTDDQPPAAPTPAAPTLTVTDNIPLKPWP